MVKHVVIESRPYVNYDLVNCEIRLGDMINNWLKRYRAWDFNNNTGLSPLQRWNCIESRWLIFEFNDYNLSEKFSQFFTDWNPHLVHNVVVDGHIKHYARDTDLQEIGRWIDNLNLSVGGDYSWVPNYQSGKLLRNSTRFSFKDASVALMFKLTFGGANVQSTI